MAMNPNTIIPNVRLSDDLREALSFAPGQLLVLFPVRLETRFFPGPGGASELRVRVYPDKVHINTHEPKLTEQELIWGKHFWEQTWRAGMGQNKDEAAANLAWQQLADRFDARRAAWIANALKPLNAGPEEPVPADEQLLTPISFPTLDSKSDEWTLPPRAQALPSRWHVLAYANGKLVKVVTGQPIRPDLVVGPEPSEQVPVDPSKPPPPPPSDEVLAIDEGMKWMVDFDEAERAGMGIRLQLAGEQARQGLDFLLVLGTQFTSGFDRADGTHRLVELFEAHHYTDGLSFVLNGTPSNNTKDAPSGFSTADLGHAESYRDERNATAFKPGDGSNADVLSRALGLRNGNGQVFANLTNAAAAEQLDARHMNRALWPATLGHFVTQMLSQAAIPDNVSWAQHHFVDYVRASGPLPALRVGRQPYGVLPVTALDHWKPRKGEEQQFARDTALRDFLLKLRGLWRSNLSQVPRIGSTNPDQDFADTLSMDGVSSSYVIRHLFSDSYLAELWSLTAPGANWLAWSAKQQEMATAILKLLELKWTPWLSQATYSGWSTELTGPIAQADTASESVPLAPDYITLLLEATIDDIRNEAFPAPKPRSLLYALLRHALLLEYIKAASSLLQAKKAVPAPVDDRGIWNLLNKTVAGVTGEPPSTFLRVLSAESDPTVASHLASLLEFRESLTWLKTVNGPKLERLSAAKLERLCAGTLDTCANRLDAWITSFATKRLDKMRQANPTGILIGGYGWVMNLKSAPSPTSEPPLPGESNLLSVADNPGYTHAPSLGQAATVAVMRSGHLTHTDPAKKDLLAINLSSERVRLASWLLDGVRQGQPLGALLGYRFERRLRDAPRLAQFIKHFRKVAPLVARKLSQTAEEPGDGVSLEALAANNVVDGLALQRKWQELNPPGATATLDMLLSLLGQIKKPDGQSLQKIDAQLKAKATQESAALIAELNLLDDTVDALSDALLAESVHHAVQGNPMRTASTLDAAAGGAVPPEIEVVCTPRTGFALTYRLVALFSDSPALPPEWQQPAQPQRADAEPLLNAWAARLLGNPAKVRCLVERFDPGTGAILETKELRLSELRLAPLDLIYAVQSVRDVQIREIDERICYALMRHPAGFAPGSALRINPKRGSGWTADDLSYGDLVELLRTARRLFSGARALDANDLNLPERTQQASVDLDELSGRADKAERMLQAINAELQPWLNTTNAPDNLEALRDVLVRASHFGVPGAVPLSAAGAGATARDILLLQVNAVAKEVARRDEQLTTLNTSFKAATATPDDARTFQVNRLQAVFGEAFVVLPRFTAENAAELEQALADNVKLQDTEPLPAITWFQRNARVREGVARLDASLHYAEVLGSVERLNLSVAQLPFKLNDHWVGLRLKPNQPLSSSRFSLIVQAAAKLDLKQPLAGLLIDEWVETVPSASETTGMVFQYDQPDAAPPQSILLAVPPDLEQAWNIWTLQQVLLETLDLARIRAANTEALPLEVGHYLPALYIAVTTDGETVSTDLGKLT
jgi:hypothetical protein